MIAILAMTRRRTSEDRRRSTGAHHWQQLSPLPPKQVPTVSLQHCEALDTEHWSPLETQVAGRQQAPPHVKEQEVQPPATTGGL
jgi:hypothetical protein